MDNSHDSNEPVAWYRDEDGIRIYYESKVWDDATPLYTTPPAQPAPVQPVAHCEAGPEFCQQCHLEDRSLALAAAVRYVKNNTPKLVSDEICMALSTPPAAPVLEGRDWSLLEATQESLREHMVEIKRLKAAQPAVPLTDEQISAIGSKIFPSTWNTRHVEFARAIEAKLKELNT